MAMIGKDYKLKGNKIVKKPAYRSVSDKIRAGKSKKVQVLRGPHIQD